MKGVYQDVCDELMCLDTFRSTSPADIHVLPLQTLDHSHVYRIRVDSPNSQLILKKPGPADAAGLAQREKLFYQHVAPLLPHGLVAGCIHCGESSLYLQDLSATHEPISAARSFWRD